MGARGVGRPRPEPRGGRPEPSPRGLPVPGATGTAPAGQLEPPHARPAAPAAETPPPPPQPPRRGRSPSWLRAPGERRVCKVVAKLRWRKGGGGVGVRERKTRLLRVERGRGGERLRVPLPERRVGREGWRGEGRRDARSGPPRERRGRRWRASGPAGSPGAC